MSDQSGSFRRFRRLQWKLTLFYILTTIAVMLILEMIAVLGYYGFVHYNANRMIAGQVRTVAQNAVSNFSGPFINRIQLHEALRDWSEEVGTEFQGYSAAIDSEGHLLVAAGELAPKDDEFKQGLPATVRQNIRTALELDPADAQIQTYTYVEKDIAYIVAPLADKKAVRGALVVRAEHLRFAFNNIRVFMPGAFQFFGVSLLGFFVGAAIVGLAFGIITSRSLVRRIRRILASANRWSQGDFTTYVNDPSGDELGQLANRLNQMAKQLQQLLRARQDMATLEERNRLARELHDSIKQQMFAVSIYVNTGKSLIGQDEHTARTHLAEAEHLISHLQQELNTLIHELRPVVMEGKNLARALEDYVQAWQEQTGISADFAATGGKQVSPVMEEAFFRIAQEALSNAARHSRASAVKLRLECDDERVTLSISDNGRGFDVDRADPQGLGMSSMRERVQALGGQLDIRSWQGSGSGTMITASCRPTD